MGGTMTAPPFDLPAAAPADTKKPGFLSLRGRLNRVRYIVYCLATIAALFVFMILAGLALVPSGQLGQLLYISISVLLLYCVLPIWFAILTVRRAHDFNRGGWIALLLFVPVVNLLFWFIPGTPGANAYGAAPDEESAGMKLVAVVVPILLVATFLASGGIHLYQAGAPAAPETPPSTTLKPYTP